MDTTQDILQGRWRELKGQVRPQFGKLTEGDIERLSGKTNELVEVLRQKYGYGKVQAEMEIDNWLLSIDRKAHAKA